MSLSFLLERFRISKYNLFDLFLRHFENFKLHIISFSLLEGWQSKEYTSFNTTNSSKSRIIWEKTRISIYNTLTIRIPEHIRRDITQHKTFPTSSNQIYVSHEIRSTLPRQIYLQYTYVMAVSKRSLDLFSIQL